MSTFEWASIVAACVGLVINAMLIVVFFGQLRALSRQVVATNEMSLRDHERRRKQATFEIYTTTLERRATLLGVIGDDRRASIVRPKLEALRVSGNAQDPLWTAVVSYLNL